MESNFKKGNILTIFVHIFVVMAAVGIFSIFLFSCSSKDGTPRLSISEKTHDFGKFSEDKSPSHTFAIRNTGTAPLEIKDVDPDCTCTVPKFDKIIPAGGTGNITLSLKPFSLETAFKKETTVRTNDPENPNLILTLQGIPEPLIDIKPSHIIRLKGTPTQDITGRARIISHLPYPLKVAYFQTSIPEKIDVTIKPVEAGKAYEVEVKNKLKENGSYYGKIEIFNNFKERPRLILRVFGELRAPEGKKS